MTKKRFKARRTGRLSRITTGISITLVLLLLGVVVLFVTIGNNFSRQLREGLTVQLELKDSLAKADLSTTMNRLRTAPYTNSVRYISKEEGTHELNQALQGDMGELWGGSPIPAVVEVSLKADYANLDSLRHFEPSMKALPGVSYVSYPRDIMESLDRTIPLVGLTLLGIAGLLAIISISLIHNTIRMNIYARRTSIHTMKLVGASWGFIRRPFIFSALGIGLVAVIIAGGALGGLLYYLQFVVGEGEVYFNGLITPEVWIATIGVVALCGILFTALCATLSVNRFLRMNESDLYTK